MLLVIYLTSALLLVVGAFVVFRIFVRRDYRRRSQLTPFSTLLEVLICAGYMALPQVYNPPCWWMFWSCQTAVGPLLRAIGIVAIVTGLTFAFTAMASLGLGRSFGHEQNGVKRTGFYRVTRNPQVVGGVLMVAGIAVLWPSWYALGWVALYAVVFHLMVLTEEEHLHNVHGEAYARYCQRVPRYIGFPRDREGLPPG